jgi:hypothetical protein
MGTEGNRDQSALQRTLRHKKGRGREDFALFSIVGAGPVPALISGLPLRVFVKLIHYRQLASEGTRFLPKRRCGGSASQGWLFSKYSLK